MAARRLQSGATSSTKDDIDAIRTQIVCSIKDHVLRYMRASLAEMEESLTQLVEAEIAKLATPKEDASSSSRCFTRRPTGEFEFEGETFRSKAAVLEASDLIESVSERPVSVRTQEHLPSPDTLLTWAAQRTQEHLPSPDTLLTWAAQRQIETHVKPEKIASLEPIPWRGAKNAVQGALMIQRPRLGASNFVSAPPGSASVYRKEHVRMDTAEEDTEEMCESRLVTSAPVRPGRAPQHSLQHRVGAFRLARMQKRGQPSSIKSTEDDNGSDGDSSANPPAAPTARHYDASEFLSD